LGSHIDWEKGTIVRKEITEVAKRQERLSWAKEKKVNKHREHNSPGIRGRPRPCNQKGVK